MVAIFDQIGIGQWFRLLTGALEVAGGVLVLVPSTGVAGALLLACVMVGAVFTHLAVIGGNPAPALILLTLSVAVLRLHRRDRPFASIALGACRFVSTGRNGASRVVQLLTKAMRSVLRTSALTVSMPWLNLG